MSSKNNSYSKQEKEELRNKIILCKANLELEIRKYENNKDNYSKINYQYYDINGIEPDYAKSFGQKSKQKNKKY
jgi:hypothetical protein